VAADLGLTPTRALVRRIDELCQQENVHLYDRSIEAVLTAVGLHVRQAAKALEMAGRREESETVLQVADWLEAATR